jgi:hypothetical protein
MTTFNDREEGMEKLFAHDEELKFKASARRNKLLGLWAADLLGKKGAAAEEYALEVVKADLERPGEDDLIGKLRTDLDAAQVSLSNHLLLKKMNDLMHEAVEQIQSERE